MALVCAVIASIASIKMSEMIAIPKKSQPSVAKYAIAKAVGLIKLDPGTIAQLYCEK